MDTNITPTLDKIEQRLPPIPQRVFKLNRAVAHAGIRIVSGAAQAVVGAGRSVTGTATTGAKTVKGQADSATERFMSTATKGAKEVAGQARAQTKRTMNKVEDETIDLLDDATDAVEGTPSGSYDGWSKDQLYARAQELDIDGRSSMTKDELVSALRSS